MGTLKALPHVRGCPFMDEVNICNCSKLVAGYATTKTNGCHTVAHLEALVPCSMLDVKQEKNKQTSNSLTHAQM